MSFDRANIDRAIVMTQYDLRGFLSPLGFRYKEHTPKTLDATTCNLVAFAIGLGKDDKTQLTENDYVDYFTSTYDEYLAMCKRLVEVCDCSQKEAIQLIIQDIVRRSNQMKVEVADGDMEPSPYLLPLSKDNRWGRAICVLAEVFEVDISK